MTYEPEIDAIIQNTFLDITKKLSGIELRPAQMPPNAELSAATLFVTAQGDYRMELVLCAEDGFLQNVAGKMKRAPLCGEEEAENYAKEYFNIVCGRIVSGVNKISSCSARIGIPRYIKGVAAIPEGLGKPLRGGSYIGNHGRVMIRGVYQDKNPPNDYRATNLENDS